MLFSIGRWDSHEIGFFYQFLKDQEGKVCGDEEDGAVEINGGYDEKLHSFISGVDASNGVDGRHRL
jgi:hypothetical protein